MGCNDGVDNDISCDSATCLRFLAVKFEESPWIVKLFLFVVVVQLVVEFAGEDVTRRLFISSFENKF